MPDKVSKSQQEAKGDGIAQAQGEGARADVRTIIYESPRRRGCYLWYRKFRIAIIFSILLATTIVTIRQEFIRQNTKSTATAIAIAQVTETAIAQAAGTAIAKVEETAQANVQATMTAIVQVAGTAQALATETVIATAIPTPECPFASPIRPSIEGPPVNVEVRITSIEHCTDNLPTASAIPLFGTYSGDLTNKEIWILVYAPDHKYYPQSSDVCANTATELANGQWSTIIHLGPSGVSESFHIVAVVTSIGSLASNAFHNYLTVGCNTSSFQGLLLIPKGATEVDSIIIHTQ